MDTDRAARPVVLLTDEIVTRVFDWKSAIASLEAAYSLPADDQSFPPRSMARGDGVWLRILSGVFPGGGVMGSKQIAASIKGRKAAYLVSLFDQDSAELLSLLDAKSITGLRTAATSVLAVKHLVAGAIGKVGVIGSGYEAKTHVRALAALLPVGHFQVFSPRSGSRQRFVAELHDLGVNLSAADSAEQAVRGADVVICAARSRDESPTFKGAWLTPGMTVVSIGSTLPEQRELDEEAIGKADLIVADMPNEVAGDTGDMLAATRAGVDFGARLVSLANVVLAHAGRRNTTDIVLYKSVGAAIQDLAVAAVCYRRAVEQKLGIELPESISPVSK